MTISSGTHLGPYEILQPIGAGGMGQVYRARDTRLNRTVAIKVLPPEFASRPDWKQRFEREAQTIASLNHPHICTLHDIGQQDGIDYLVMEFLEGQTMAKQLEKGAVPLDQALKIAIDIADALDKAHRQGIVHRDLKPANVMLTKSGVKLLDFGLAKLISEQQFSHLSDAPTLVSITSPSAVVLGTPAYMSPEQIEGKDADTRSDIYAVGLILYEMFTGRAAFEGETSMAVAAKHLAEQPVRPRIINPSIPSWLERIILGCIQKNPAKRFQTIHEVGMVIANGGASGKRWKWAVTATVLALATGIVSVWLERKPESSPPVNSKEAVSIIIADFDNLTHESVFNGTLEPMLGVALEKAPFVSVYSHRLALLTANQLRPGTTRLDETLTRLIADKDEISVVVTGSIEQAARGYKLTVHTILDPVTANKSISNQVTANTKNEVLDAVAKLGEQVRRALGDTTNWSVRPPRVTCLTTMTHRCRY
jgi:serine/threonine protein kinase